MKLPKIDLPIYEMNVPSTGEKIKFRPFTVKEEKILLTAKESKDSNQNLLAVKQVLNNCLIDKDIEDLSIFDVEYLLLMIRGKSINNVIEFIIEDPETNEEVKLVLNVDDVKITKDDKHTNIIKLNSEYMMYMKYPNIDMFKAFFEDKDIDDPMVYYEIMIGCIDKVVSAEEMYKFSEFSRAEIDQFMDDLESDVIDRIKEFFDTAPRLRHEIKYKNKNGNEKTFVIEGMDSFFI